MTPLTFVRTLRKIRFEHTFNPYADTCAIHDRTEAPRARAKLLLTLLEAAVQVPVDAIWIGRDLGYRGGRRTGLALTDDVHMEAHGARWGIAATRPTKGEVVAERTAAVIWRILSQIEAPIFLWNVFPLHPHEPEDPFTNRSHNSKEAHAGEELLVELVFLLKPKRLIAIGNDAAYTAYRLASGGQEVVQVRHPSYGGQTEFLSQMRALYRLPA
jgi:hypothetical protein